MPPSVIPDEEDLNESTMTAHKLCQHFVHFPNPCFLPIIRGLDIRMKTNRLSRWWCTQNFELTSHKSQNRWGEHLFSHWFLLWAVHIPCIGSTGNHKAELHFWKIQLIYDALIFAVSSHSLCPSSHNFTSSPYHIFQTYFTEFVDFIELSIVWLFASIRYFCLH